MTHEYDMQEYVAPGTARRSQGGCTSEPYVRTGGCDSSFLWVTLPGADRTYMLTAAEGRKLFRDLERLV